MRLRVRRRAIHERESRLEGFEAALAEGIADAEAGRVRDMDEVFDELKAEFGSESQAAAE